MEIPLLRLELVSTRGAIVAEITIYQIITLKPASQSK